MYSSLHNSSQRHFTDSSQYLRPFASVGQPLISTNFINTIYLVMIFSRQTIWRRLGCAFFCRVPFQGDRGVCPVVRQIY